LARFFVATAERLLAPGVIPAADGAQKDATNHESFALLLFGLKDVDQADAANAVPLLKQFVDAKPAGKFAWISELKPVGQKALDRFAGEVKSQEKSLAARAADQKKAEEAARVQERKKLLEAEQPAWNAALTSYKSKVAAYDFAGARDSISAAKVSDQGLREAQAAALKKAQWLIDWKTKLMGDLNRTHFTGDFTDLLGAAKYSGIDAASPQNLRVKIGPYGSAQIAWTKFAPKTLLTVSKSFNTANAPDLADRQWLSAVFAAETNQTEEARLLAEAAAKVKPEYQIPLLFPPAGSSR